ncbi:MAG: type III-B CRISPR module-associated Cmr3 family protein [Desulfatirhabdiaceae bacterium]
MIGIKQWIKIDPLDTVFFKGSEPMVAGQNHEVRSVFPPMPSTIIGAIRTAILSQRKIDIDQYVRETDRNSTIETRYPLLGTPEIPGFKLVGPLLHAITKRGKSELFYPSPAHWFADEKKMKNGNAVSVAAAKQISEHIAQLGITGSVLQPAWVMRPENGDLKSLSGYWINAPAFQAMKSGKGQLVFCDTVKNVIPENPVILKLDAFVINENRIGIALETGTRRVKEGHLYSSTQMRLNTGVQMIVGFSAELIPSHLDPVGVLQLGGELRISAYHLQSENIPDVFSTGQWAMNLSAFPVKDLDSMAECCRVSGPLTRMGGWDMKKGFHKPMQAYMPAGSVIKMDQITNLPFGFIRI